MWRLVEDGKLREGGSTMTVGEAAGNAGRGGGWFCDGEGTSDVVGTGGGTVETRAPVGDWLDQWGSHGYNR